ncbi:MAG: hypothetical protein PHP74_02255, partial [Candidatus Gracilibacteria bacterium]|nr:hypothetical protein [Candidatus Gracilibacteria bacterium]
MKFFKKILATLITALLTTMVIYGGYTIYAAGKYDFEKNKTLNTIALYHNEMNNLFNKSLAKVALILKDPEKGILNPSLQSPCVASDFQKPNGAGNCEKKCRDDAENVSTYCVSVRALDMYMAYMIHLGKIQSSIDIECLGLTSGLLAPTTNLIYTALSARDEKINQDIEDSRRLLEATLSAYNEFMIAYPIH